MDADDIVFFLFYTLLLLVPIFLLYAAYRDYNDRLYIIRKRLMKIGRKVGVEYRYSELRRYKNLKVNIYSIESEIQFIEEKLGISEPEL